MKKFASIIAASLLLSSLPAAVSAADNSPSFEYLTRNGGICILSCTNCRPDLIIPDNIDNLPVTSIADTAFEGNDIITSCTIPDSVEVIGAKAFRACSKLNSITIGSSVSEIGEYAFTACPALSKIEVSKNNPTYSNIGGCLYQNSDTLLLYAGSKDAVIPDNTKTIAKGAFFGKADVTSVTIPNSVSIIDENAFSGCVSLKSVDIPDSVKSLGKSCFMSCNALQRVSLGKSLTSVPEDCFHSCSSLETVSFSDSLFSIGSSAFYSCSSLSSIYIPPTVRTIGSDAIGKRYNIRSDSSENIPDFVIRGEKGSAAEKYAELHKLSFKTGKFIKGDVNGDKRVDSVDASTVLKEYSVISSGGKASFTEEQSEAADWNADRRVDSVDASAILAEYARLQTL